MTFADALTMPRNLLIRLLDRWWPDDSGRHAAAHEPPTRLARATVVFPRREAPTLRSHGGILPELAALGSNERLADTDVRTYYRNRVDVTGPPPSALVLPPPPPARRIVPGPAMPLTVPAPPLAPLPSSTGRAVPDVPRACWCGRPAGHVAADLAAGDDDAAFTTAQFEAVPADG